MTAAAPSPAATSALRFKSSKSSDQKILSYTTSGDVSSKTVATMQGQPRAEVAQAVFQTAEWKHFIKTHYQELHSRYPDIQSKCKTAVVMSRTTQQNFKSIDDIRAYTGLIMEQFNIDEFFTFDDLYERACTAHALLSGLSPKGL